MRKIRLELSQAELRAKGFCIAVGIGNPNAETDDVSVMALIDTGASRTYISEEIAQRLRLRVVDETHSRTVLGMTISQVFHARFHIPALKVKAMNAKLPAARTDSIRFEDQIFCIIGRDWLSLLEMSWIGPKGIAELRTPRKT